MAILDFCTGISQLVQNESTQSGISSSGGGYELERILVDGGATPAAIRKFYPNNVPTDYFWLSFSFNGSSTWGTDDKFLSLEFGDSSFFKISTSTSEDMNFNLLNSSGEYDTIFQLESGVDYSSPGSEMRIDIEFDFSSSGSINLYLDRSLVKSYSGDISHLSGEEVEIMQIGYLSEGSGNSSYYTYWSNVFFADEDSTLLTMVQSQVTGDGAYSQLDGDYTDVQCIGKTGDNTSLMSDSNGQKSSFTLQDRSGEISSGTIAAVGVYCRINQDNSANDQARMFLTNGSGEVYTDYFTVDQYITPHRLLITADESGDAFDLSTVYNYEVGIEVSENG
jgi:hypothetical protein